MLTLLRSLGHSDWLVMLHIDMKMWRCVSAMPGGTITRFVYDSLTGDFYFCKRDWWVIKLSGEESIDYWLSFLKPKQDIIKKRTNVC
jgi:hypothetical protein